MRIWMEQGRTEIRGGRPTTTTDKYEEIIGRSEHGPKFQAYYTLTIRYGYGEVSVTGAELVITSTLGWGSECWCPFRTCGC